MCSTWSTDRNIVSRGGGGGLGSKLHILLTHKLKSKMAHFAFVIKQNKKSISHFIKCSFYIFIFLTSPFPAFIFPHFIETLFGYAFRRRRA